MGNSIYKRHAGRLLALLTMTTALALFVVVRPVHAQSEAPEPPVAESAAPLGESSASSSADTVEEDNAILPQSSTGPGAEDKEEPELSGETQQDQPVDLAEEPVNQEETPEENIEGSESSTTPKEDSQPAMIINAPDPYFDIGGVRHRFFGAVGVCASQFPGDPNCYDNLTNPIQAAIDYLSGGNLRPDLGRITVEADSYPGFTINGSAWSANLPTLIHLIGAGSPTTNITSGVTITNLINFSMSGFNITGGLHLTDISGTITLTDVKAKNTGGNGITISGHSGAVVFQEVVAYESSSVGAYIDNRAGTQPVTINNSRFTGNTDSGLTVLSRGAITITGTHAGKNGGDGARLINTDGTGLVRVALSTFNDNALFGLLALSNGTITLDNAMAVGNVSNGAQLANASGAGGVLVRNSQFLANGSIGLEILSARGVTLDGVLASDNGGNGVEINNSASPTNRFPVIIQRSNFVNNTAMGLKVTSRSPIVVDHVTALFNGTQGVSLANNIPGSTSGVTIRARFGESHFTGNGSVGLEILSRGTVSVTRVTAMQNSGGGMLVNNSGGRGNITITFSRLESNANGGGTLVSSGAILVDRVSASFNTTGNGLSISNNNDFSILRPIRIQRSAFDRNASGSGLYVQAKGGVDFNAVSATHNAIFGLIMDTCQNDGNVCLGKGAVRFLSTFGENAFNNNGANGIDFVAGGAVSFSGVAANSNTSNGVVMQNTGVIANVTVNTSRFMNNGGSGFDANSAGNISILNSIFSYNGTHGADLDTLNDQSGERTVTLRNSVFNENSFIGVYINGTGTVTLSGVTANGNINAHGMRINNLSGSGGVVASGAQSQFINNQTNGLFIQTNGAITLSNLLSTNNSQWGMMVINSSGPGTPITLRGITLTHNGAAGSFGGLFLTSNGNILLERVNASHNPGSSAGAILSNNLDIVSAPTISLLRSTFNSNNGVGVTALSYGDILLNNVQADGNYNPGTSSGASLTNWQGSGRVIISDSFGENSFSGNTKEGLYITSSNLIQLRSVRALQNGGAGAILDNSLLASDKAITISASEFSYNQTRGLDALFTGNIFVDRVITNGNLSHGILLNGSSAPNDSTLISVARSSASGNQGIGFNLQSSGLITLNSVKAQGNNSHGVFAYNQYIGTTSGVQILSQYGANWFSGNNQYGLYIMSNGPLSLSRIAALGNGVTSNFSGVFLNSGSADITITCALLSGNGMNGLSALLGTGTLTLNGVTAVGNDVFGGSVDPDIIHNGGATVIINPAPCSGLQ